MCLLVIALRTKIVRTTPSIHTTLDLKNFEILSIWILSDIFDIMPSAVPTKISGSKKFVMKFAMKVIISSRIGCTAPAVTMFPCGYH